MPWNRIGTSPSLKSALSDRGSDLPLTHVLSVCHKSHLTLKLNLNPQKHTDHYVLNHFIGQLSCQAEAVYSATKSPKRDSLFFSSAITKPITPPSFYFTFLPNPDTSPLFSQPLSLTAISYSRGCYKTIT